MKILVTGSRGVVGRRLAGLCDDAGLDVVRAGRRGVDRAWLAWDMAQSPFRAAGEFHSVLHTAPLWLLPDHIEALAQAGVRRVIAFSSTSATTKQQSASRAERELASLLTRAEDRVRQQSARFGLATTLFRPTMIYGYGLDHNISTIAVFIRRYGFFAVAGRGAGKRQPVHADDLANAAVSVMNRSGTSGRTYTVTGGETLTYRDMVARIFHALNRPVRIIRVPAGLYRFMLAAAGLVRNDLTGSMAVRMNRDLVFDSSEARDDFGYAPQPFLQYPDRDLPSP